MDINIAELRHRITLEEPIRTPDGQGGNTTTWQVFDTVWAKVTPSTGVEILFAQQLGPDYDNEIVIRKLDGISPKMRVLYNSKIYHIKSIIEKNEKRFWNILKVMEGVAS